MKLRENIDLCQNSARVYDVNESEIFLAVDLFDKHFKQQVSIRFSHLLNSSSSLSFYSSCAFLFFLF